MLNKALLLLFIFALGCSGYHTSYTDMTSIPDPAFEGRAYDIIAVQVNHDDLILKKRLEDELVEKLRDIEIKSYPASLLLPPTRDWSPEEAKKTIQEKGIQAVLVIEQFEFGGDSVYIPSTTSVTDKTVSFKDTTKRGKPVERKERETVATHSDARMEFRPWLNANATLFDVGTDAKAWVASMHCAGYPTMPLLYGDIANGVMREFTKYKMIRQK